MQTAASLWRIETARSISSLYAHPAISAIALGGSSARGIADAYSDIELGIYWREAPSRELREAVIRRLGALVRYRSDENDPAGPSGIDVYYIGDKGHNGLKVDVIHWDTKAAKNIVHDVIKRHESEITKQELVAAIQDALLFKDDGFLSEIQRALSPYPEQLQTNVLNANLQFGPFFGPEMLSHRPSMFLENYEILINYQRRILNILYGLNKMYHPGDHKWLSYMIAQMTVKPHDIERRLQQMFSSDLTSSWTDFSAVLLEVRDLLSKHTPHIDLTPINDWFRVRRAPISKP